MPEEVKEGRGRKGIAFWLFVFLGVAILTAIVVSVAVTSLPSKKLVAAQQDENKEAGNIFSGATENPTTIVPTTEYDENEDEENPSHGIHSEDCSTGEKVVEFFIELDQDSNQENGWTLQCGPKEIWNVPVGYLEETKNHRVNNQIMQTACVDENETCDFTIQDSYGDGLVEGGGSFYLRYGATTVATSYDSMLEFTELSYCFGPKCDEDPLEVVDECEMVYLSIGLDATPEDTTYEVECNGEVIFLGPWGDKKLPFDVIQEETCLPMNSCCTLTVGDASGDGLSLGVDGYYGHIYLEYGLGKGFDYRGEDGAEFFTKVVEFGSGC